MQNEIRDKLVMLIDNADEECRYSTNCKSCSGYGKGSLCRNYHIADHLIAHDITFKDVPDINVGEWISVKDRLPNRKKGVDGETYFKNVAVRVKGCEFEKIAFYDDEERSWFDTNFFPAVGEVTHWCELPEWYLPQPPKGE